MEHSTTTHYKHISGLINSVFLPFQWLLSLDSPDALENSIERIANRLKINNQVNAKLIFLKDNCSQIALIVASPLDFSDHQKLIRWIDCHYIDTTYLSNHLLYPYRSSKISPIFPLATSANTPIAIYQRYCQTSGLYEGTPHMRYILPSS